MKKTNPLAEYHPPVYRFCKACGKRLPHKQELYRIKDGNPTELYTGWECCKCGDDILSIDWRQFN